MTSCGQTSERVAGRLHFVVFALYMVMGAWHLWSTFVHFRRDG